MKRMKSIASAVTALALGMGVLTAPQAAADPVAENVTQQEAQLEQVQQTPAAQDTTPAPAATAANGDYSENCSVDWNAQTVFPGPTHVSGVTNPLKVGGENSESAGFLTVHGWGDYRRVIAGTVYPVKGATLTITSENGFTGTPSVTTAQDFLWSNNPMFGQYGEKYPNKIALGTVTTNGNTITIALGDLRAYSAIDVRVTGVNTGSVTAKLGGTWNPVDVAGQNTVLSKSGTDYERYSPDCFRPTEESTDGDLSQVCNVNWNTGVIVDRRYQDWTNNGYTQKVAPKLWTDHLGNLEVQHYIAGDLRVRVPVVTNVDINDAVFTVDLPNVGSDWVFEQYINRTFGVINEADYTVQRVPLPTITKFSDGTARATVNIGDMPAKSYFTLILRNPGVNEAKLDELTKPVNGDYSNAVEVKAQLTGTYDYGTEGTDCVPNVANVAYDDSYTNPGDAVNVNLNNEASAPRGTKYEVTNKPDGWAVEINPTTGALKITPPAGTDKGIYDITVTGTTPQGYTFDVPARVHVDCGCQPGKDGVDGKDGKDGKDAFGSSERCTAAALTVGLPLLLLIPFGLASQLNIPGLTAVSDQFGAQLAEANTRLQQQLGIYDEQTAQFVAQFNAQFGGLGANLAPLAGGLALVAAGLLAANHIADNCRPGADDEDAAEPSSFGSTESGMSSQLS
ncbi:YPDG domain-containing protein [Corynebacterium sanguinis]|uniref:YPDG domain-containing protein n=1 Tax=Corynebacterium sanguinis TaxID=2594913 RepID=UPI002651F44D|nr:YPDG domain-containing protein [Corynebacterium sanguinis]MDN8577755.1 YPDG domain-containing protein [Corynebacterium sanguinis]